MCQFPRQYAPGAGATGTCPTAKGQPLTRLLTELEDMSYRDLQGVAKQLDIKANQSTEDLVEEISEELDL